MAEFSTLIYVSFDPTLLEFTFAAGTKDGADAITLMGNSAKAAWGLFGPAVVGVQQLINKAPAVQQDQPRQLELKEEIADAYLEFVDIDKQVEYPDFVSGLEEIEQASAQLSDHFSDDIDPASRN